MDERRRNMCPEHANKKMYIIVAILFAIIFVGGITATMYLVMGNKAEQEAQQIEKQQKKEQEDAIYAQGNKLYVSGKYEQAINCLVPYASNQRIADLINSCYLKWGQELSDQRKYGEAIKCFEAYNGIEKESEIAKCNRKIQEEKERKKEEREREKNRLVVEYNVFESKDDSKGIYHKNGEGTLKMLSDYPMDDWVGGDGKYITYTFPQSSINFRLSNIGKKALKNVTIILAFDGIALKEIYSDSVGFCEQNHINGIGGWAGAVKFIKKIQSGLCVNFKFDMWQAYSFNGSDGGNLQITVSADDYKAHTYTVPIKVK